MFSLPQYKEDSITIWAQTQYCSQPTPCPPIRYFLAFAGLSCAERPVCRKSFWGRLGNRDCHTAIATLGKGVHDPLWSPPTDFYSNSIWGSRSARMCPLCQKTISTTLANSGMSGKMGREWEMHLLVPLALFLKRPIASPVAASVHGWQLQSPKAQLLTSCTAVLKPRAGNLK